MKDRSDGIGGTVRRAGLLVPTLRAAAVAAIVLFGAIPAGLVPADAGSACVAGVSRWDTLNVRSGPSTRERVLFAMPADACGIEVTGPCQGNWCVIRYRGRSGWAHTRYLVSDAGGSGGDDGIGGGYTEDLLLDGIYCTDIAAYDRLNIRAGPGTRYRIVGSIGPDYCGVRGTGRCLGRWCEITARGRAGWVNTRYLRNIESGY